MACEEDFTDVSLIFLFVTVVTREGMSTRWEEGKRVMSECRSPEELT